MSDGPIHHWWKSHAPVRVSTPDAHRICAAGREPGRGYCGRRSTKQIVNIQVREDAAKVTCSDCIAGARADAEAIRTPPVRAEISAHVASDMPI